jgi:hypothetical protein
MKVFRTNPRSTRHRAGSGFPVDFFDLVAMMSWTTS